MQKYTAKRKKHEEKRQQVNQWIAKNKKTFAAIVSSAVAMLLVVILTVSILYAPPEGFKVSINKDGSLTILGCIGDPSHVEIPSELKYGGKMRKVTSIGEDAFFGCWSLKSIVIPDCVTSFMDNAFCYSDLYEVRYMGSISDWCAIAFDDYDSNPLEYADKFYVNGILIEGELILPDNITSIGNHAFYGFKALTSVTIGKNVTTIGSGAFADCDNLTSVVFEDPYGWHVGSTPLVLTNAAKNATELSGGYRCRYIWTKS